MYINLAQNTCEGGLCCDYAYDVFSVCGRDSYRLLCGYQHVCTVKFSLIAHTVHKNKRKAKRLIFRGIADWLHGNCGKVTRKQGQCVCEVSVLLNTLL